MKISIAIHGYGTYAVLYRHLIDLAKTAAPDVEWAMLLPTSHHLEVLSEVVSEDRLLCLEHEQARNLSAKSDLTIFAGYQGNVYADIEAEKQVFKHRHAAEQVARAAEIYDIYRAFLERIKPTHLLMAHVETFDGKVLIGLAKELNISVLVPVDLRNIGGTFFSADASEALPSFKIANENFTPSARKYLDEFRFKPKRAVGESVFALSDDDQFLPLYKKPLMLRALGFIKRTIKNPRLFEPALLRISLKYAFPSIREAIRKVRGSRNKQQYDVAALEELPEKFVYYPLQTTPESSINTPAPYFVDQSRAIDAIRFAMPSDWTLIVKEHLASLDIRPRAFYKALRRKAGVQIAYAHMPSIELIKRAQVTISVTGTATLEAFLLGRPSLVLGGCFVAEYVGGICPIDQLPARIRNASQNPPSDQQVLKALQEIYDVRYECTVRPADEPGSFSNRLENVRRILAGVLDHIERSREASVSARKAASGSQSGA